ncbi:MAG: hypothetical protein RLZZ326_2398, partial [Planctomycetota bacterium]
MARDEQERSSDGRPGKRAVGRTAPGAPAGSKPEGGRDEVIGVFRRA